MNPPFGEPTVGSLQYIRTGFPSAADNVLVAFALRFHGLLWSNGKLGTITDRSFVNKRFYEDFRVDFILKQRTLEIFADLGWNVLDDANVEVAAHVHSTDNKFSVFANVSNSDDKALDLMKAAVGGIGLFVHNLRLFRKFPGSALVYDLAAPLVRMFANGLVVGENFFTSYGGLKAGDADHLFRLMWEVPQRDVGPDKDWALFQNGSPFSPFYFGCTSVVRSDSASWSTVLAYESSRKTNSDRYFESGIFYGKRTDWMYGYKVRKGHVPSMEGHVILPIQRDTFWHALLIVNSSPYQEITNKLCGQHKYAGYINPVRLEIDKFPDWSDLIKARTRELESLDFGNETSSFFGVPACVSVIQKSETLSSALGEVVRRRAAVVTEANSIRKKYNDVVETALDWHPSPRSVAPRDVDYVDVLFGQSDSIRLECSNLLSYCIGVIFGRWDAETRLESMDSCHKPSRVKMWDGMWSACGESGAIWA
jgi:hypothetical protein